MPRVIADQQRENPVLRNGYAGRTEEPGPGNRQKRPEYLPSVGQESDERFSLMRVSGSGKVNIDS